MFENNKEIKLECIKRMKLLRLQNAIVKEFSNLL